MPDEIAGIINKDYRPYREAISNLLKNVSELIIIKLISRIFFRESYWTCNKSKTNKDDVPAFLQIELIAKRYFTGHDIKNIFISIIVGLSYPIISQ